MAEVIWAIPALNDLESILEYIDLDNPTAARVLAQKVFERTDRLEKFPDSGSKPKKLKGTPYRRIFVDPVFIYHRREGEVVYVIHASRAERAFDMDRIIHNERR